MAVLLERPFSCTLLSTLAGMWGLCKKELIQFFSSLSGYIAIAVFLLVNGLVLFVFEDNLLDFGYATLDRFFELSPWVLLLLIPAITMRSFSEEFRTGTYEVLSTQSLTHSQIVLGKYLGALIVVLIALLPTFLYAFTLETLAADEGIDRGATLGSYAGLFLLAAVFTAIGIWCSSLTSNIVVAFLLALLSSALFYYGFNALSQLSFLSGGADYWMEWLGIDFHYRSISRGLVEFSDLLYFASLLTILFVFTLRNLQQRS
jgi:ABC-2 type transport system permease protein